MICFNIPAEAIGKVVAPLGTNLAKKALEGLVTGVATVGGTVLMQNIIKAQQAKAAEKQTEGKPE